MKVAICASEVVPFAKTGGLADVTGALPLVLEKLGVEAIVIMPRYKQAHNLISGPYATIGKNVKVYFIENDAYFGRDWLYGDKSGDYKDNLARFSYYCKKTLSLLKELDFHPDIIHCHDWQSALIPVYLKTNLKEDNFYKKIKTVFTIHNLGYQGLFPKEEYPILGLEAKYFNPEALEFYGRINLLKAGIVFSDIISTVSPTYSKEIQGKQFGFGLEGVLKLRAQQLFGILNGIDYSIWDPQTDKIISSNYSASDLSGKEKDKQDLQKICNLPQEKGLPLFGIVSRLAEQKGFDLLEQGIEAICKMPLQLVILGTGDQKYHRLLERAAKKYPNTLSLHLKFDDSLAHKIYAGCDVFLMPSKYEPCGLGQLISLRYGTIPLVFKTGGLSDTVNHSNGFVFERYNKEDLLAKVKEALGAYSNKKLWSGLMKNAFSCDFSWESSAKEYLKLYEKAKSEP